MTSSPSIARAVALRLVLLALGGLVGLLTAEGLIRLVAPQPGSSVTPGLYAEVEAELPRYRLRPGYEGRITNFVEFDTRVRIDGRGMREPAPATPEGPRILTVGDSFVFGWGVEGDEAFPVRLAGGLELGGRPAVGFNGGVPGYGLPDAVAWVERWGAALEPSVVVFGIFPGNDPIDATDKHGRIDIEGGLVTGFGGTRGWRDRFHAHFHLFRLAKTALGPWVRKVLGRGPAWEQVYLRDVVECYARTPGPLILEGRERTREAARRVPALLEEIGARGLVVLMPGPLAADPERFARALESFDLSAGVYAPDEAARWFAELFGREIGLDVLDLGPAFREGVADGESLFFRHDPHWTVAGHDLAAREIRQRLEAGAG